jgi:hypothetical protein
MNAQFNRQMCRFLALAAVAGLTGCSDRGNKVPKVLRLEGIAQRIDLQSKEVSMKVKRDDGKEDTLSGTIRDDTEVFINGRQQKLGDVREGDRVVAYVQKDKSGDSGKYIVTKVEVERPPELTARTTEPPPAPPPVRTEPPVDRTADPRANTEQRTANAHESQEQARQNMEDVVYGQIRLKMEESIAQRAQLLKQGTDPADPQIRRLEHSIMKARELLAEHGEILEDVEPPIVVPAAPTTQPATP